MKLFFRRITSLLLALVMVLSLAPVPALASESEETQDNPWEGRSAVFVGDSITAGAGTTKIYYQYLNESLGFSSVTAMGVSGSCISAASDYGTGNQPLINRYQSIPSADLILIFMGTNDYGHETPLGTVTDTQDGTFYGALNTIIPALVAKHTSSKIVFVTSLHRYGFGTSKILGTQFTYDSLPNGVGATLGDYVEAAKTVCEKNGVSVIDLHTECTLDPTDAEVRAAYMPDGIHPNAAGHEVIAEIMESHLRSYEPVESEPVVQTEMVQGNKFAAGNNQPCRASSRVNYYLKAGTVITLKNPAVMQWACARTSNEFSSNNLGYFPDSQWTDKETAVVEEDGWVGFTFKYRDETQAFDLSKPLSDYITIEEPPHTHTYENGVCTICGAENPYVIRLRYDDRYDITGKTVEINDGETVVAIENDALRAVGIGKTTIQIDDILYEVIVEKAKINLVVIMGQSNAGNHFDNATSDVTCPLGTAYWWQNGATAPVDYTEPSMGFHTPLLAELYAQSVAAGDPVKNVLIWQEGITSKNGQSIVKWAASATDTSGTDATVTMIQDCRNYYEKHSDVYEIVNSGVYWLQGESDTAMDPALYTQLFMAIWERLENAGMNYLAFLRLRWGVNGNGLDHQDLHYSASLSAQIQMINENPNFYMATDLTENWVGTETATHTVDISKYITVMEAYGKNPTYTDIYGNQATYADGKLTTTMKSLYGSNNKCHYGKFGYGLIGADAAYNMYNALKTNDSAIVVTDTSGHANRKKLLTNGQQMTIDITNMSDDLSFRPACGSTAGTLEVVIRSGKDDITNHDGLLIADGLRYGAICVSKLRNYNNASIEITYKTANGKKHTAVCNVITNLAEPKKDYIWNFNEDLYARDEEGNILNSFLIEPLAGSYTLENGYLTGNALMLQLEQLIELEADKNWCVEWKYGAFVNGSAGFLLCEDATNSVGNKAFYHTSTGRMIISDYADKKGYRNYTSADVVINEYDCLRITNRYDPTTGKSLLSLWRNGELVIENFQMKGSLNSDTDNLDMTGYPLEGNFAFGYLGHDKNALWGMNCELDYLAVTECVHTYENGSCTACGAEAPPLAGKTISILGASISTYGGTSNGTAAQTTNSTIANNAQYYPHATVNDVTLNDTWWMQVCNDLGLRLLVNNSWSGSSLLHTRNGTVGAYVDRCVQLHDDTGDNAGEVPDIIGIQMGTNDFQYYKDTLGTANIDYDTLIMKNEDGSYSYATPVTSLEAAAIVLHKISIRYPNAEVYYLNISQRIDGTDELIRSFNAELKQVVEHFGAHIVDIYGSAITMEDFDTYIGDGRVHPNKLGMDVYTEAFKRALLSNTAYAVDTHTVSLELNGVTADYGDDKIVVNGGSYTVKLTPSAMTLDVTVTMGGKDITTGAYTNGTVTIASVTGDVTITAKSVLAPKDYRWEFDGSDLSCVSGENVLTKNAGTTTDGVFSKTRYALENAVILLHDLPWVVEWKCEGTFLNANGSSGARIFTSDDVNAHYNARYIFKSNTNGIIAMGEKTTSGSHNYGIALADYGVDWTALHTYRLENCICDDGSNMIWLFVDGVEIGPMNHYYIGTKDQNTTSDWLSGKDFVFPYMGTDTHGFTNCSIDYIRVAECDHCYENGVCTACGAEHPNLQNFNGKVISILGDSISTFAGYIPVADGFNLAHRARYPQSNLLTDVNDTWWMQVLTTLDVKLGINDSWAGSRVINTISGNSGDQGEKAAMASLTRIQNLGSNGTPDVILFYGGTNDIGASMPLGTFDPKTAPVEADLTSVKWNTVADAYTAALLRMKHFYPDAQIVAMLPTFTASYYTNAKLEEYNAVLSAICSHYDVRYLDLRDCGISTADLPDGIHPDATGMDYITGAVLDTLLNDVEMEAGESVVHSVTHNLNGVESALGHYKGVTHGKSFVTTITGENVTVSVTMGGVDITDTAYSGGVIAVAAVTDDLVITAQGRVKPIYEDHLQQLPENLCCGTNLWTSLVPENTYYTGSAWGNVSGNSVYSITIPVAAGDRIWATSFQKSGTNGGSRNGIRLTWFDENGVLESVSPDNVYAEFSANAFVTAPADAVAVNVVMWNGNESNEVYILSREHTYKNGVCTICGATVNPYLQQLPENIIGCTNLYDSLSPVKGYYTATKYDTSNGEVLSVVIPVEPGDRIAASSFGPTSENMGSVNGIRVTYLLGDKIVTSVSPGDVYNGYKSNGYITVPDGVDTVCIPWWVPSDSNWLTLRQISKDFAVHIPKTVSAQAPTCTENGYTAGEICEICNASLGEREAIPPTGHSYSGDTCTVCGTVNLLALLDGKYVSVLGDSISTFNGYSNDATVNTTIVGNGPRYDAGTADTKPGSYCLLESVDQTWWMHFANRSGMKLLVNNSWAGSQVFGGKTSDGRVIPAAYLDRCVNLHDNTLENNPGNAPIDPDVIFVYLGINDYNFNRGNVGTGPVDYSSLVSDDGTYIAPATFGEAYGIMLHKMRNAYPDAQIFAMTLLPENLYSVDKTAWEQHNAYIRAAAEYYDIPLVDLAENCAITWENYSGYMIDKIHPTTAGMKLISDCIETELVAYYKENPPHTHSYKTTVTAPTCTQQGYTTYTCDCGDSYVSDYVDATGHSYENGICTACGAKHPNLQNYKGKVISILGGSTCTFDGYIPVADGFNLTHRPRYPQSNLLTDVSDTWWMQLIAAMDAKLGINDSWAGSQVLNTLDSNSGDVGPDAAMASLTRIQNLGANGIPDVILFYGAMNDIGRGVTLGSFDSETAPSQVDLTATKWNSLADAYVAAIMRMQYYYPDAQIVAMLPGPTASYYTEAERQEYCAVLKAICDHYGVPAVDLSTCGLTTADMPDGTHPNAKGMDYITEAVLNALLQECKLEAGENIVHSVTHDLTNVTSGLGYYKGVSNGKSFVTALTGDDLVVTVTMGGVDITQQAYAKGAISIAEVTGAVVITAKGRVKTVYEDELQLLPENICCGTNLWTLLTPVNKYYTATGWGNSANNVYSVTFPVAAGDRIYASSFRDAGENGFQEKGVRITWFSETGVLKSVDRYAVYAEFAANGYLTAPEGAVAVNIPMIDNTDTWEIYILSREHTYKTTVTTPTCTEQGYTTYTCECGDSYVTDYVDATGHTYKNGICTGCGEEDYDGLDLNGLNVLCLGDSITAGQGLTTETRWTNVLASKYGWNLTNKSQGGISLSSFYYTANGKSDVSIAKKAEILKTMTTKPDVIIVWGGHNDTSYRYSPLGTWDDETTDSFKGALKYIAELADEYAPDATLFVLTPLWTTEAPSTLKVPENTTDNNWMFVDAIYEGAEAYGWIPVNMDLCGITPFTKSGLLLDNIHPNEAGTEKIVAYLSAELASYSETSKKETIIFNASAVSMKPGESTTLKAVLSPRSGTGTMTFTWSSSDSSVATVDASGKITAVAPGTAVITATAPNGISADISVSVVCEHTYEPSVTAPTCTQQGYTTYTCTICGDSFVDDYVAATGHTYANGACTVCGVAQWDTDGDGVLEILAIGNSFSVDALQYAYQIAQNLGIEEIVIGNLYIGGCTLETHAANAAGDLGKYTYYYNDNGTWTSTGSYKISTALESRSWDYISMQQGSPVSGVESSYNEDLTNLIAYVQERSDAKLVWHMTWAYQQNSTHSAFPTYGKDQMTMYNAIVSAVQNKIVPNESFDLIVPNGTAVQNSRTSLLGDTTTRDGYHMSYEYGRYLTGLLFIKTVTGLSIDSITYAPSGVDAEEKAIAIESANNAAAKPFAVTQSAYVKVEPEIPDEGYILLQPELHKGAYWYATDADNYNIPVADANNSKYYFATIRFTREALPVGSIIILEDGWQYRPEGWITDSVQSSRANTTIESYVLVTEEWWGDYTIRGFNISKVGTPSIMDLSAEDIHKVFRIYVPEEKHTHKYENGACILCGESVPTGTVDIKGLSLELESVIFMNFKCVVEGFEGYDLASNMGLLMWTGEGEYSEELFVVGNENVTVSHGATYDENTGRWVVKTPGIAAKEMGNEYYIRAYVALPDGTYIYSTRDGAPQIHYHGVQKYALGRFGKDGENFDKVIAALMDYAAAAQVQFGYKLDDLANDIDVTELTTELGFEAARAEEILAAFAANKTEYSADMVIPTVTPDSAIVGSWIRDTAAKNNVGVNASLTLEGIITNNYKFSLKASGTVAQAKFLYWTTETYEELLAKGEAFSEANATEVIIMEIGEDGRYVGEYDKTAAKEMGKTIYVCGLIETTDGTVYNSGIVTHSAHAFLNNKINDSATAESMVTLAKALIVYGDAAETYFANR